MRRIVRATNCPGTVRYGLFYAKFVSVLHNEGFKRQRYLERIGKSQCSSEEETKF